MAQRFGIFLASVGLLLAGAVPVAADDHGGGASADQHHRPKTYTVTNLVSDGSVPAAHTDPNLVNAWGLVAGPTTPWWVANNGTGTSTLYNGAGSVIPLVVTVPGGPTGTVFNGTSDFVVTSGASGPARFLFANESGMIEGWNPAVPASGSTLSEVGVDRSAAGAVYKGLAIGQVGTANYLYATDFHNGRVDVFDGSFALQSWPGAFVDPKLPKGYAPFGIQNIGGHVFVTFARQDAAKHDEIAGHGRGFVSVFGTDGTFKGRVGSRGPLDAPWGLAMAPAGFGPFSGDLLVGNFGDGRITAFRREHHHWKEVGQLRGANNHPLSIDGLWGIGFGNGTASGPLNTLYFAAGPDGEAHGLFGSITATP